jgi:hypothetical protein
MSEGMGGKVGGKFQMLVEIEGIPTKLLLDSGSEVSLISLELYKQIPQERKPKLRTCVANMKGITGDPLAVLE